MLSLHDINLILLINSWLSDLGFIRDTVSTPSADLADTIDWFSNVSHVCYIVYQSAS